MRPRVLCPARTATQIRAFFPLFKRTNPPLRLSWHEDMQYGNGKRGSFRTCLDIRTQSPYRMPDNCQPLWKKFHRGLQPPDGKTHQDCFGPHLKPLSTINDYLHVPIFMTCRRLFRFARSRQPTRRNSVYSPL